MKWRALEGGGWGVRGGGGVRNLSKKVLIVVDGNIQLLCKPIFVKISIFYNNETTTRRIIFGIGFTRERFYCSGNGFTGKVLPGKC